MNERQPWIPVTPLSWWLKRPSYIRYMLRELTCIWIGAYVVMLITGLYRLQQGPAAWESYLAALGSTTGIVFQCAALAFALYHTISWFSLAPSTMPIWRGETRVPPRWIEITHYIAFIAVSVFIAWLAGV